MHLTQLKKINHELWIKQGIIGICPKNPAASVQLISASKPRDTVSNGTHQNESAMEISKQRGKNEEVITKQRENSSGDSVSPVIPVQPSKPVCYFHILYIYIIH